MSKVPKIVVLAGVNGAGKSSVAADFLDFTESVIFNPDAIAKNLLSLHPNLTLPLANGHAWTMGRDLLQDAIAKKIDYRFETTLGGNTIPRLLAEAAESGHQLHLWFCGLSSPDLHLARVKNRVSEGGHDIPEEKIYERWDGSRKNLIRLLPHIHHLRIYDNSIEANLAAGQAPQPRLILEIIDQKITAPTDLTQTPEWAQPILAVALRQMISD